MNKRRFQFHHNRNYSAQYTNDEFGSLNSFLQIEDTSFTPASNNNGFTFLESSYYKSKTPNQMNMFSIQNKRNSLQLTQLNQSYQHSPSQKTSPKTLYDTFIKGNRLSKIDKIPLDSQSPKIVSVKEKKDGIIQKLFQVGFEMMKPSHQRDEEKLKLSDENIKQSKKIRPSDQNKMRNTFYSLNNSPNRYNKQKMNQETKQIDGKTFKYENYIKRLQQTKQVPIEINDQTEKKIVYDNFVEEKIDSTKPAVILGLSSNYRSLVSSSAQSPNEYDYKRHKMKKKQYLVRTTVKYIENERKHESLSNYDKSFQRLKGNVVNSLSQQNKKLSLSKGDQDIIQRYRDRGFQTAEREKRKFYQNNKENAIQKNIDDLESSDESIDSVNSDTRRFKEKQNELKEKIKFEIQNLKNKMSKKHIERQYISQSKAENFIQYQQILDWAKVRHKDKLKSVQHFEQNLQQMKTDSSPQKIKEKQKTAEDSGETVTNQVPLKSQDIMKRVLQLDKVKQSNRIRSNLLKAKNRIGAIMKLKQFFMKNDSSPGKNETIDFYNSRPTTPVQKNIFSLVKKQSTHSDQQLELNSSFSDIRQRTIETPPQELELNTITSPMRNTSTNFSKQVQKIDIKRIQNKIDYKMKFLNGLGDVINDIHKGNYL